MLCLYYATHTLRTVFPEMDMRLKPAANQAYMGPLTTILSNRNFLIAGVVFSGLNCGMGFLFGNPYGDNPGSSTIYVGLLMAGFVCGMAAYGIFGVLYSINKVSYQLKTSLDYTSPDHCGGTTFLGEALVIFGSVTLIAGVMISVYILNTQWTGKDTMFILFLKWIWVAFPYVMSLVALIGPAIGAHKALREYKIEEKVKLMDELSAIQNFLKDKTLTDDKKKALQSDFDFLASRRRELHEMRTWPFGFGANLTYLTVVIGNFSASAGSVLDWRDKLAGG